MSVTEQDLGVEEVVRPLALVAEDNLQIRENAVRMLRGRGSARRSRSGSRSRRRRAVTAVLVIGLMFLAACSSSPTIASEGGLDGVPLYPGSTAFGEATFSGSITVRSFRVGADSPTEILRWYGSHLDGWTEIVPPDPSGETDLIGRWMRGSDRLQVSAALSGKVSQYSLIVAADGAALP